MPVPQFLSDLLQLLFDLAVPAAFCTLVAAGVSLRHEGGTNFHVNGKTGNYTVSSVPSLTRVERGKVLVTGKVLVAAAVTIGRLGSYTGTGEEWAGRPNAVTAADA